VKGGLLVTIKEVSEKYDITPDTLRYYEHIGIIPPVKRTAGGIRNYDDEDVRWILNAKCMRNAGLPIETLIRYLELYRRDNTTLGERLDLLNVERERLEHKKDEIENTISLLDYKIKCYEEAVKTGILEWKQKGEV